MDSEEQQTEVSPAPDLYRRADGRLVLRHVRDGRSEETPVHAVSCFPWSYGGGFICLRAAKGEEMALIERLEDLPAATRRLIEDDLQRRLFVPRIVSIRAIETRAEFFLWRVGTDGGDRSFLVSRHEHPRTLSDGRMLIRDVGKDLYLVENPQTLDPRSHRLLWAYMD